MNFADYFKAILPSKDTLDDPLILAEKKFVDEDAIARRVVAKHSHGNIRLQQGKYFTKSDVNEKFERLRTVRLSDA